MGILCSVCVWHSIIPLLDYDHELALTADRCALVIMGSVYFMFHVCFFLYIYFVVSICPYTYQLRRLLQDVDCFLFSDHNHQNWTVFCPQALKKRWTYNQKDKEHKASDHPIVGPNSAHVFIPVVMSCMAFIICLVSGKNAKAAKTSGNRRK